MKTFAGLIFVALILPGALLAAWVGANYWNPGTIGTPAHAGIVSNGRPEECRNVSLSVAARSAETYTMLLNEDSLVRGTVEAQGGLGRVDIMLRVTDPLNAQILQSPRSENYDFTFPVQLGGDYRFVLDNRYSLYTSKSVGLYICVEL